MTAPTPVIPLREIVARALCACLCEEGSNSAYTDFHWISYAEEADAVLRAIAEAGLKVVDPNATDQMLADVGPMEGTELVKWNDIDRCHREWFRAMVLAAPDLTDPGPTLSETIAELRAVPVEWGPDPVGDLLRERHGEDEPDMGGE